jgi:ATP-dependent Zn protease
MLDTMRSGLIVNGLDKMKDDFMNLLPNTSIESLRINEYINMSVHFPKSSKSTKSSKTDDFDKDVADTFNERTFKMTLVSPKSTTYLNDFINNCITEFDHYECQKAQGPIQVFRLGDITKSGDTGKAYPLITDKTFDNLFFEGKDALIKRLNTFKDKSTYRRLGIQDALGLLFHGEPGTGKTSAIKAIAKYMDMHLLIVPMNTIRTKRQLEELFYSQHFAYRKVPSHKRIYVFEEIDCNEWAHIVKARKVTDAATDNTSTSYDNISVPGPSKTTEKDDDLTADSDDSDNSDVKYFKKKINRDKKDLENDKVTLGTLLELMDGLVEFPGRLIIMTTNHPEVLDPALLRPGRIDMHIHFNKLRGCDIANIYKIWTGFSLSAEDIARIPNDSYTQAQISQLIFKYEFEPHKFLEHMFHVVDKKEN